MSALHSRISEAITHAKSKGVTIAQIAKVCEVSKQSVYQWMKEGARQEIEGSKLVELAVITGF